MKEKKEKEFPPKMYSPKMYFYNLTEPPFCLLFSAKFNQDVSHFSTSKATTMRNMFKGASIFNQDLLTWDTSNVLSMQEMFNQAANFNRPLISFDTSRVENLRSMFYKAGKKKKKKKEKKEKEYPLKVYLPTMYLYNLTEPYCLLFSAKFNQDVSHFSTSKVISMYRTFYMAEQFNQDLSTWDVSQVTSMYQSKCPISRFYM